MIAKQRNTEWSEVRRRAAEVRRNWSPVEKERRMGLPPDIPTRLKQFILGESEPQWSPAVCGRIGGPQSRS
jgi:hypothetical protein